jgi:hypothetical protein
LGDQIGAVAAVAVVPIFIAVGRVLSVVQGHAHPAIAAVVHLQGLLVHDGNPQKKKKNPTTGLQSGRRDGVSLPI